MDAKAVARFTPAEDVDDLDTARRLITALREKYAQIAQMVDRDPTEGDHTVFLDPEHERKLVLLYEQRKLIVEQEDDAYNEEYEFDDVFEDFIQAQIDLTWDIATFEKSDQALGPRRLQRPPTA